MMSSCTVRMPAKINLSLGVGPRRNDGYHELATIFQAVDLYDKISVVKSDEIELKMIGHEAAELPVDGKNLAVKAAKLLRHRYGTPELGAKIEITKKIPIAGGMAGGSGNAAAVLLACNMIWRLGLSKKRLAELALEVGSDVPFLLSGGTAVGYGRGEKLTELPNSGKLNWVLATSRRGMSTPRVFEMFDAMKSSGDITPPDALVEALANNDRLAIAELLRNDLQPAVLSMRPDLRQVLAAGERAGALASIVSGSGPTCVFFVENRAMARRVASSISSCMGVASALPVSGPAIPSIHTQED